MFFELLKPGIKVKRYIFLLILSVIACSYSIVFLNNNPDLSMGRMLLYVAIISVSVFLMILSFVLAERSLVKISMKQKGVAEKEIDLKEILVSQKKLNDGPRIVVIGGGSGLSNMLRGLKKYSNNITAIVTMFDDGGSTGRIRKEMDILPPGDVRRCVVALSSAEPEMERLIAYRFTEGSLKGHSFGNLLLAAMCNVSGSFPEAINMMGKILVMKGQVLPVTLEKLSLCAELEDGSSVEGESHIEEKVKERKSNVKKVYLSRSCEAAPGVIEAIEKADIIVAGPGSLYTSIVPNLLVTGVSGAIIDNTKAMKVYICNIMNQPKEEDNLSMSEYLNRLESYIGKNVMDYCIINNQEITDYDKDVCNQKDSIQVPVDTENVNNKKVEFIFDKLVTIDYEEKKILHNTEKLSAKIYQIWKSGKTKKNTKTNVKSKTNNKTQSKKK